MALGGFGGGGEDISFKVFLETAQASGNAEEFFKGFKDGVSDSIKEFQKLQSETVKTGKKTQEAGNAAADAFRNISDAAKSPIQAVQNLASQFFKTNPAAQDAAKGINSFVAANGAAIARVTLLTAAIAGLGLALKGLIGIAANGDRFSDISDGFKENAENAGVFADVLKNNLSAAFTDQLDNTQLLIQANKLFAAGLNPSQFDDIAAAAKRYADRIGIEATDALDQLTQALATGRESLLKKFGTIKDGVLVLDAFTAAEYEAAKANRNVTDTVEFFSAKLKNLSTDFAQSVNESDFLKLSIEALGSVFLGLAKIVKGAGEIILGVLDFIARRADEVISTISAGVVFASEVLRDLKDGSLPDITRATAEAAKQFGIFDKATKKAGTTAIKFGKETEGAGKSVNKLTDQLKKEAEEVENIVKENIGAIERLTGGRSIADNQIIAKVTESFTKFRGNYGELNSALAEINFDIISKLLTPENAAQATKTLMNEISKQLDAPILGPGNDDGAREAQLAKFNQQSPTIFGIDSGLSQELSSALEGAISTALDAVAALVTGGSLRDQAAGLGAAIGNVVGTAIGTYFGSPELGAAIGTVVGGVIGEIASAFGEDTAGTKARKEVDKFFADLFDANRLSVVINGQLQRIKDLQVNPIDGTSFGDGTFDDAFSQQNAQVQGAFNAVGTSFEQLLGVSEEISGQIAAVLFNNIGGSLVNLQALLQSTGKSFEDLGDAMFQAFFNGQIGLQQLQDGLVQLNELFSIGIPGQIGAIDVAVQNLQVSLQDDKGSRIIFNSLKSIGQEAIEAGKNLGQAAAAIAQGLGLGAEKVALFLEAMKLAGIKSVQDLVSASNAQLAALGANILQITQGGAPTNSTVQVPTNSITSTPNFNPVTPRVASSSRSAGVNKAEQERKRLLEQLRNETERLITSSDKYNELIGKIGENERENTEIGRRLRELYQDQFKVLRTLQAAQEKYNKALEQGADGKKLGKLAKDLKDAKDAADKFGKSLNNAVKPDLTEIVKLITNVNQLGEVLNAVGVSADALKEVIVQGFKAGKISIQQANDQLRETTDLLGGGIPGKVGAIADAFTNLQKAGTQGGVFSLNAFKDIFAEFQELFNATAGPERQAQLRRLREEVDAANQALQSGIDSGRSPEEVDKLRKRLEGATKALSDLQNLDIKPELEDLRTALAKTFDPREVDKFFAALSNSGINSLADFQSASDETIIKILGDLQGLGFKFADSVDEGTKKLLDAFNAQNVALNGGKDILGEQLNIINQILGAAGALSPAFTSAGVAVKEGFDAPLNDIANQIGSVIQKLTEFKSGDYQADVILNVSTRTVDGKTQTLLDILFGDGSGSTIVDENPGTGGGLTSAERSEFEKLRRIRKSGKKLSSADQRRLRELEAKRGR